MKDFGKSLAAWALIGLPLALATPAYLQERENGCIALCGQCPCPVDPPSTTPPPPPPSTTPPPPPPTTTAPPAYGCLHAADPDGAEGYCPAVAATGWCVCSDSSTYGITSGDNPCPYTAPPASGPTTLASTDCSTTAAPPTGVTSVPSATVVATSSSAAPTASGFPDDQVSCPVPLKDGSFQYFTKPYIPGNVIDIINNGKKGSYPKPFNPKNPKSGQFTWDINDCGTRQDAGEAINELPMYLDSNTNEQYWSTNTDNNPGPYREYYILKDNVATYCGAYAHKDKSSNGDFARCS